MEAVGTTAIQPVENQRYRGGGEDWECLRKVTVMSCTHKLRKLLEKVGCEMSLVGGTR